uniref:C2H2-type domain-containing protein n=1 Tax=Anopheles culicifacies TaxID=139723 RepID=A0A182MB03_9DIPT
MRRSKRTKIANAEDDIASAPDHDLSGCSRCCICSLQPEAELLELSTIVENSNHLTIAAIVEQVAGIKVKHVQKRICSGCWSKIQAAYSIQKEIRGSKYIKQPDDYESGIEHVNSSIKEESNALDTDYPSDEQYLENPEIVEFKQDFDEKDGYFDEPEQHACEYLIEYLEDSLQEHEEDEQNIEEEQQLATENDLNIVIETSDAQQYEELKAETSKVTRWFKMPNAATIVSDEQHDQYRVIEVSGERCCGCSFVAQTRKELLQHSETIHCVEINDHGDYCPICFYKFSTDQLLDRHIQEFKLNNMFVCLRCNHFFNLRSQLFDHLQRCKEVEDGGDISTPESDDAENNAVIIEPIQEDDDEYGEYYLQMGEDIVHPLEEPYLNGRLENAKDPRVMHHYKALFEEILSDEKLSSPLTETELNVQETQIASQHVFETFNALLVEHSKTSHPMEGDAVADRSCRLCWAKFPNETELVKHWCFFITKQLFFCTVCDETFLNKESLRHHQQHNERHRQQESLQFQQAGIELDESEAFVEIDQPAVADELGKLLTEKGAYRTKVIPMPDERFIKRKQEYNNYTVLTVKGEYCCGCAKFFDTI